MLKGKDFMAALQERVESSADNPAMANATKVVYDEMAALVDEQLKTEGQVGLPKIGTLKVEERPASTKADPETGETVERPASVKAKFGLDKKLKASLSPSS